MKNTHTKLIIYIFAFGLLAPFALTEVYTQTRVDEVAGRSEPGLNRSRGQRMLKMVKSTLEEYYYDKNYRGIDIDQKFKEASEKIKTLDTNGEIFTVIAGLLLEFNDSHTRFYPPGRSDRVEYGFSMQMVGNACLIVDVKTKSDAEKKGLKVGDQIVKIGIYPVGRENLWILNYFLYQLEPLPALPITILDLAGNEREVVVVSSFKSLEERRAETKKRRKEKQEDPYKCHVISHELVTCKLSTFSIERKYVDQMMEVARKGKKLILDLRGNRGGYIRINEYLTGHFFDREVKIADMITRRKKVNRSAKPVKNRQYSGELIVLIDSDSASASEVFARVIQLERRGIIVGDVSAGAVMTSYSISLAMTRGTPGYETITPFGMNITIGDVLMSDGNRLEHVGVIPDHPVGPTRAALASGEDPVLAYAAELMKVQFSATDAGKLGLLRKKSEDDDVESDDETH